MKKLILILTILMVFSTISVAEENDLFMNHGSIMMIINPETGEIVFVNFAASTFYEYSIDELLNMRIQDINTLSAEEVEQEMKLAKDEKRNYFNFRHITNDGSIRDVEVYSYPIVFEGEDRLFSIIIDVSDKLALESTLRKRDELDKMTLTISLILISLALAFAMVLWLLLTKNNKALKQLTEKDQLTKTNNRLSIRNLYEKEMRKQKIPLAFFMIDVNNLKFINDTYGHVVGDRMIIGITTMLSETIYKEAHVGRVSGDEFVVIVSNCGEASATELEKALKSKVIRIEGIHFSASIGLEMVEDASVSFEQAFSRAETKMYNFKTHNKANVNARIEREMISLLYDKYPEYIRRIPALKNIVEKIAEHIDFSLEEKEILLSACELQDIGLVVVEVENRKEHSQKTYSILNALNKPHNLSNACFYHHEHYDGTGYPKGLIRGSIPYIARVLNVINRIYDLQSNLGAGHKTLEEMKRISGNIVDPEVVSKLETETFLSFIDTL